MGRLVERTQIEPRLPRAGRADRGPNADARERGFTVTELLVAVTIVGFLAAVAVPTFTRHMRKAKTSEATQLVERIYEGARAYYADTPQPGIVPVAARFPSPSAAPTPADVGCCADGGKCMPAASHWDRDVWVALQFSVASPHYYSYSYVTADEFDGFTARANGDLDCDTLYSTFEMFGAIGDSGEITGGAAIRRLRELE